MSSESIAEKVKIESDRKKISYCNFHRGQNVLGLGSWDIWMG